MTNTDSHGKETPQAGQTSLRNLMNELKLPALDIDQRRQGLVALSQPYADTKFQAIVGSLSDEEVGDDNFLAKVLLTRLVAIDDFEELRLLIGETPNELAKVRITLPDLALVYEGIRRIRETDLNVEELSDVASSCVHTTTYQNAISDIEAGSFRPASTFSQAELRNSITHFRNKEKDTTHYDDYLNSGHMDYVFFSSTAWGNLLKQVRTYSHGETPVVFWTEKDKLAQLGLEQEYNTSLFRYYSDTRVRGEVPVGITKMVFTDTSRLTEEQMDSLGKTAPVLDLSVLAVVDLVASLARYQPIDSVLSLVSLFPRGEFVYKDGNYGLNQPQEVVKTKEEVSDIWRKFFKLD
jgi:hypothetical protein